MNLLDTASLVVTPNGYKASKLYSIVPSDGTGDMTFARTGDTATRVNSSGLIETVLANKPRLDYTSSTCPKLLLEPQRTNLFLQSQDISSASWTKTNSPTIVSNSAVAPDGTTTADSIQDTTGTTFKQISQSFSVSANSTYTYTFYIKKETSRTNYCGISLYFSGGTNKSIYASFDEVNGIATALSGGTLTPTFKVETFGSYWKVGMTATDNGSNTTLICEFFPTISTNGTTFGAAAGSARTVWGFQLEAGSYATSYIPTTTASVTRNVDSCGKTGISALLNDSQGTVFFHGRSLYAGGINWQITDGSDNNVLTCAYSSTLNIVQFLTRKNTNQVNFDISKSTKVFSKFAFVYNPTTIKIFIDGVLINSSANANSTISGLNQINFKTWWGGVNAENETKAFAYWKTALSDSECIALTSL